MRLKKMIAAGLIAAMPLTIAACDDNGDDLGDDNGVVDDTTLDDGVTETTAP
jgi:hypothetical protein